MNKKLLFMTSGTSLLAEQIVASLCSAGFQIVFARSTAAVKRSLVREAYDVVLIEAEAPEKAYDACRALRLRWRIPIVILNQDSSPLARLECYDAGADLCLATPIQMPELVARLSGLLRRVEWNREENGDHTHPVAA